MQIVKKHRLATMDERDPKKCQKVILLYLSHVEEMREEHNSKEGWRKELLQIPHAHLQLCHYTRLAAEGLGTRPGISAFPFQSVCVIIHTRNFFMKTGTSHHTFRLFAFGFVFIRHVFYM